MNNGDGTAFSSPGDEEASASFFREENADAAGSSIAVRFLVPFDGRVNFSKRFPLVPGESAASFFDRMRKCPGWEDIDKHIWKYYVVAVNEVLLHPKKAESVLLREGDIIVIFAALIGG